MRLYERMTNSIAVILLAVPALLCACEKTDEQTGGTDGSVPTGRCLLETPLIDVVPFGGGSPQTRAALQMEEHRLAFNTGEELGNIITLGNSEVEDTPQTRADDGIYYRIVVYTLEEWNKTAPKILEQRLCKTGSTTYVADLGDKTEPIYLYQGEYRIFCYSFNKTTTDKMDKLADGAVNVSLSDGDDFLSADVISTNIAASQVGTSISLGTVTLEHRCCQFIGILTAEYFTGTGIGASPAPALSAVSTFTTAGNWSIKGNSFASTATASQTKAFTMVTSGNDYKGTMIILPITSTALSATYNFQPNGSSANITAAAKQVNASVSIHSGASYNLTIKAVGAYVLTVPDPITTPIQIGKGKWAYANLNRDYTMEKYPWVSGNLNGSDNDYWKWNYLEADVWGDAEERYRTEWEEKKDPCIKGLGSPWRVPSYDIIVNLGSYALVSKYAYINGMVLKTSKSGFVSSGTIKGCVFVDTANDNCIFLPAAGVRANTTINDLGKYGHYWGAKGRTQGSSRELDTSVALEFGSTGVACYWISPYYGCSLRCSQ